MQDDKKNKILDMLTQAAGVAELDERSRKYRNIVGILAQQAVQSADSWYLEEALKTAELVTEDASKAYVEIIRAMAKIGAIRKDEQMLRQAVKTAGRIDNNLDLSVALHEIGIAFAKYGIDKKDERIFSYSLELIERIPLNTFHSSAFRNISRMLAGSNPERAMELLETAIELIEKSKDTEPVHLISAFCDIASLLAKYDDERSFGFIRRAITLADDVADDFDKSAVLLKIVETEIAIGTQQHNEGLLKEASLLSEKITREYYKTLAFNAIGSRGSAT
ncbi:MAG: hypothetical protein WC568_06805 [Candidatus Methanoperedens sp.]